MTEAAALGTLLVAVATALFALVLRSAGGRLHR